MYIYMIAINGDNNLIDIITMIVTVLVHALRRRALRHRGARALPHLGAGLSASARRTIIDVTSCSLIILVILLIILAISIINII